MHAVCVTVSRLSYQLNEEENLDGVVGWIEKYALLKNIEEPKNLSKIKPPSSLGGGFTN